MSENENYLDQLNEVQREAVTCTEGPVMIVAGAGSGKTRVLTYRIAHLIREGKDPFSILALTFTNKAAREMKERIAKIVPKGEARNLWMGTFHSVFARILRAEAGRLGYPSNFTIYDTDDSKNLIKQVLDEQGLDEKIYKPGMVLSRISAAKNMLISSQAYLQNNQAIEEDRLSGKPKMGIVYEQYQRRLVKAGAMDFDDLLFNMNVLLRDHPVMLDKYQDKFRYIMVDEYQDTNFSQYMIVRQLAARFQNICVVGDDAQSIYGFRGASIQNILSFEKDYPEHKIFKLEQNYRSTKNIVQAANTVIGNNREQIQKEVWTANDTGEKIRVMRAEPTRISPAAENIEGQLVADSIFETKMNKQAHNHDFAVLYRTNSQSRAVEEALRKRNIPYRIYGGLSFYQRKEIKDMLAYFRMAINPHDEQALRRVINYPIRGIGGTTVDKITIAARDNDVSMWTILDDIQTNNTDIGINAGTRQRISDFVTMIKSFQVMLPRHNAYELGQHIAQHSGLLKELYADKEPEGVSRYENLQELLNGLKEFSDGETVQALELLETDQELARLEAEATLENTDEQPKLRLTLDQFMQNIALMTDADKLEKPEDADKVSLMTIHSAKGLEFPYVYIVGMEENLFPSALSLNSRADLEEERRLFYVALTRAEKQCTLSWAKTRYRWGNLIACEPSRFLDEIDASLIEETGGPSRSDDGIDSLPVFRRTEVVKTVTPPPARKNLVKASTAAPASFDNSALKDLQVGMTVQHERFGTGKVLAMEGVFPNSKATVSFETAGQKQLLLKFAKLTIVA